MYDACLELFFSKLLMVVANLCNLRYCANKFVCTVLTDLQTRFLLKIDIHLRFMKMSVLSNRLKKILLVIAKFRQHAIFCKYICAHCFDRSTT